MISLIFLNLPSIHFSLMYDPQDSNYKKLLANPYRYSIFGCTQKCTHPLAGGRDQSSHWFDSPIG